MAASNLRNVTILGSSDAGKTTLVESLAHLLGATSRKGTVNEGTTLCDFTQEEKDKHHSLQGAVVRLDRKGGASLNLIDSPGYPDFIADAATSLGAADAIVLTMAANMNGIPFHAKRLWDMAGKCGLARAVALTKVDGENLEVEGMFQTVRDGLGQSVVPFTVPDQVGPGFSAVSSAMAEDNPNRAALVDAIVEADDDLMEKYLEDGDVSNEELEGGMAKALGAGTFAPIFCVNPVSDVGVQELADFMDKVFPAPEDMFEALKGPNAEDGSADKRVVARVWKVRTDKHLGQITHLRLMQGTLAGDATLQHPRTGKPIKINGLSHMFGKDLNAIDSATSGDIVAVSRVEDLAVGDEVVSEGDAEPYVFPLPEPFTSLAVRPKSRADEQKIGQELGKVAREDPTLRVRRDEVTHETVVDGLSELHLTTALQKLESRGVGCETSLPIIAYQETITANAEGHHRHKKQSGGRGQFGECYIRVMPSERGSGFEFVDKIVGGAIPRNFIPAVEKGMNEQMVNGIIANSRVVDLTVELYDGKYHDVDSDELSFKMAGSRALRDAFMKAKPILLEPIMEVEITVPNRFFGDVTGDLNTRRGRVLGMDAEGDFQTIKAQVPLVEMQTYSTPLRSITAGEGMFTMAFDHYDQVPSHLQEKIIADAAKSADED